MQVKHILDSNRGMILIAVLGTLLIVVGLANIAIMFVGSQSRLTHHQVGRIQGYYSALSGIMYSYEMIRRGTWVPPAAGSITRTICTGGFGCSVDNSGLPYNVTVQIFPYATAGNFDDCARVTATVDYAYQ